VYIQLPDILEKFGVIIILIILIAIGIGNYGVLGKYNLLTWGDPQVLDVKTMRHDWCP